MVTQKPSRRESVRGAGRYKYLTFRMVRQGLVQLRDIKVQMQAQYWHAAKNGNSNRALGGRDHHKGRVVSLPLEQDSYTTLEQLQVWHRLDEHSPLWKMRDRLGGDAAGIEPWPQVAAGPRSHDVAFVGAR